MYLSAGGSLPTPDAFTMASYILAVWSHSQIAQWMHANISCTDFGNLMASMYTDSHLKTILLNGPFLITIYTAYYTQQQLIDAFLAVSSHYTWQLMLQNSVPGHLLDLLYFNDMAAFYTHANTSFWQVIAPLQESQLPYTRTAYYNFIQTHFSATTYQQLVDMFIHLSNQFSDKFVLNEWHIYGSSRIGTQKINRQLVQVIFNGTWNSYEGNFSEEANHSITFYEPDLDRTALARGNKRYELTNHLGNVLVVISDKKLPHCVEGTADYYTAEVMQATDYSAFGVILKNREYYATSTDKYRYGFNGKEGDDETYGEGNAYDFGARIYDARIGRFLSVDPLAMTMAGLSPYMFAANCPIRYIDVLGLAPSDPFESPEEAAIDFGRLYNGISILQHLEYGALIYRFRREGKTYYTYNIPTKGKVGSVRIRFFGVPIFRKVVADVHTHGSSNGPFYSPFVNEFSREDRDRADRRKRVSFLVSPDGALRKYDPMDKNRDWNEPIYSNLPSDPKEGGRRKNNIDPTNNLPNSKKTFRKEINLLPREGNDNEKVKDAQKGEMPSNDHEIIGIY